MPSQVRICKMFISSMTIFMFIFFFIALNQCITGKVKAFGKNLGSRLDKNQKSPKKRKKFFGCYCHFAIVLPFRGGLGQFVVGLGHFAVGLGHIAVGSANRGGLGHSAVGSAISRWARPFRDGLGHSAGGFVPWRRQIRLFHV